MNACQSKWYREYKCVCSSSKTIGRTFSILSTHERSLKHMKVLTAKELRSLFLQFFLNGNASF